MFNSWFRSSHTPTWQIILCHLLFILVVIVPWLFLEDDAYIRIFDNLDSEFVYFSILKNQDLIFSTSAGDLVEPIMNGLPRGCMRSGYNLLGALFYFFNPLTAYALHSIVIRLIGYIGMYLLCRDYLLREKKAFSLPVALVFSFISVYTIYGISVLGLPLLIWAIAHISIKNEKHKVISWIVVLTFPFMAYFIMIGPFVLIMLGVIGLYFIIKTKKINFAFWLAILCLTMGFVLSEITLLQQTFASNTFISHRTEWNIVPESNPLILVKNFLTTLIFLPIEASSFLTILILSLALVICLRSWSKKEVRKSLLLLVSAIVLIVLIHTLFPLLQYPLREKLPVLNMVNLRRFTLLLPFLLFVLFALSIENAKLKAILIYVLLSAQGALVIAGNDELRNNLVKTFSFKSASISEPTFSEFFQPALFENIHKKIGRKQDEYRVICVGMHPSIAQYNGFYTLDSYQNNYPVDYKHQFRRIIARELEKNDEIRHYFDDWGNRCLLFSSELGKDYLVPSKPNYFRAIENLEINHAALKELGCSYVFSTCEIRNAGESHLRLFEKFAEEEKATSIWVYEVE